MVGVIIADMLTRIRNANQMRYETVEVLGSKMTLGIAEILKREGYITVKESGQIILTEEGNKLATDIYEKYCLLKLFLTNSLGIGEELAHKEACKMEHIVSDETVDKIERYLQKHNVVIDTALR